MIEFVYVCVQVLTLVCVRRGHVVRGHVAADLVRWCRVVLDRWRLVCPRILATS